MHVIVNSIKYTPVADIVDYFKNVHKMSRPIECTSMVTQIAINLGCPKMANLAYIEGYGHKVMYLILVLTILSTRTSWPTLRGMVTRRSGYLTQAFDCTLVKVLHYCLTEWERHVTASHDHLTLTGELAWR
jgi:hypothetical protein